MIRSRSHILMGFLLALVMATTAAARPAIGLVMKSGHRDTITMVICAGDGAETVTVTFNRDGQQEEPSSGHDCATCPACTAQAELADAALPIWTLPLSLSRNLDSELCMVRTAGAPQPNFFARGPPKES